MEESLEYILGNSLKDELIEYIKSHPNQYDPLIKLALLDKQPHSSRAAYLLSKTVIKNDVRVKNYIPEILDLLLKIKDGQQRDLINVLYKMEVNEEQEGLLFDICVKIWCKLNKIPSVRYTAFKLILNVAKKHVELYDEIILLCDDDYIEPLSAGIRKSIQKMVEKFKEEHKADG